ncbi:MAG: hypothetical protein MR371_07035 [Clostridia bacterium]|nr:hypothetical protein [Clostridia bacterium]
MNKVISLILAAFLLLTFSFALAEEERYVDAEDVKAVEALDSFPVKVVQKEIKYNVGFCTGERCMRTTHTKRF